MGGCFCWNPNGEVSAMIATETVGIFIEIGGKQLWHMTGMAMLM